MGGAQGYLRMGVASPLEHKMAAAAERYGPLLSRRGRSLPATAGGGGTHRDPITPVARGRYSRFEALAASAAATAASPAPSPGASTTARYRAAVVAVYQGLPASLTPTATQ